MKLKRILALALAAALVFCLAGCTVSAPQTVLTIDGMEISAGMYLLNQYNAYLNAQDQLVDPNADVLTSEIEGVKGAEWIHANAIDSLKRYVYLEKTFAERGLSFTEEEQTAIDKMVDSIWDYNEATLTANGIGKETYRAAYTANQKYSKIVEDYESSDEGAVTDDEAKAHMNETYVRMQILTLPTTDKDYNALDDESMEKIRALADEMVSALNAASDAAASFEDEAKETLKDAFEITGREYADDSINSYTNKTFLTHETMGYEADFLQSLFDKNVGDAILYEGAGMPMVYLKIANYEDDAEFTDSFKDSILNEMAMNACSEKLESAIEGYAVQENASAVSKYSPKNIKQSA